MDEAPPISLSNISEIKVFNSIILSSHLNNASWDLKIKIKNDNLIFTITLLNDFPNLIYEDLYSLLELKENNKLLCVYDNINQIYDFFEERIKNEKYKKEAEGNYFKITFKSPMIKIKDIIIKVKEKELDRREILLMMTKEIHTIKKSYSQIEQKISNLSTSISNLTTSISNLTTSISEHRNISEGRKKISYIFSSR